MTKEEFKKYYNEVLYELGKKNLDKGNEYSRDDDVFYTAVYGASIQRMSEMKYLDTLRSKHEVSIKSMINDHEKGVCHSREQWLEKITDNIMYLIMLYAMANDLSGRLGK